ANHRVLRSFPTRRSSDLGSTSQSSPTGGGGGVDQPRGAPATYPALLIHYEDEERRISDRPADGPLRRDVHMDRPAALRTCRAGRSEEHTSELQSPYDLVC